MSDAVQIEVIHSLPQYLTAVLGVVTTILVLRSHSKLGKIQNNTNGMQATIERLAEEKGEQKERDREKP